FRETLSDTIHQLLRIDFQPHNAIDLLAVAREHRVKRLGLRDCSRKTIEDESWRAFVSRQRILNQRNNDLIGHEGTRVHDRGDFLAEFRARLARRTQHVARRELNIAPFGREALGLGAFAGGGRAEQDQVHFLTIPPPDPRSFERLMSPSYWCATRCDWICATVSSVTEMTIRIEVPPR